MTNQHSFVSSDRFDRDLYTSSKTAERVLNAAIVQAEVTESFEEYLEIFLRSSTPFTQMMSKSAATRRRYSEKRKYARFSSTSLSRFT